MWLSDIEGGEGAVEGGVDKRSCIGARCLVGGAEVSDQWARRVGRDAEAARCGGECVVGEDCAWLDVADFCEKSDGVSGHECADDGCGGAKNTSGGAVGDEIGGGLFGEDIAQADSAVVGARVEECQFAVKAQYRCPDEGSSGDFGGIRRATRWRGGLVGVL